VQQHQRQEAHGIRLRQQLYQQPPQADCFTREIVPRERPTRGRGIPLVEDEIDHPKGRVAAGEDQPQAIIPDGLVVPRCAVTGLGVESLGQLC